MNTTDSRNRKQIQADEKGEAWGQKVVSFQAGKSGRMSAVSEGFKRPDFDPDKLTDSYWCYDTPGILNPGQVGIG